MTALTAARVHTDQPRRLSIYRQPACGHPSCDICIPDHTWYVVVYPDGAIVGKCQSQPLAVEYADHYLAAVRRQDR